MNQTNDYLNLALTQPLEFITSVFHGELTKVDSSSEHLGVLSENSRSYLSNTGLPSQNDILSGTLGQEFNMPMDEIPFRQINMICINRIPGELTCIDPSNEDRIIKTDEHGCFRYFMNSSILNLGIFAAMYVKHCRATFEMTPHRQRELDSYLNHCMTIIDGPAMTLGSWWHNVFELLVNGDI